MTPESPVIAELRGLLDALCEESITPEQVQRLEQLVLINPEAEAYYVQFMSFYADLARTVVRLPGRAEQSVRERAEETRSATVQTPVGAELPLNGRPSRSRLLGLSALGLAALAVGVFLAILFLPRPGQPTRSPAPETATEAVDDSVAVLINTNRAEWVATGLPTRPGALLPPGRLILKSGLAQIEFYSGATVILEGPAEFRLVSRMEAYCARGKLRATVPHQAQGFRIGSPVLNLVDRGTEFGMDVGGEKTAVHVFQGKVELYDAAVKADAPKKELTTGQSVSFDAPGGMKSIDPNPHAFLTAGELADRSAKDVLQRQREWLAASDALRKDPRLLVFHAFQNETPLSRTVLDISRDRQEPHDGAIVGCAWGNGRWNGRQGLEFKRASDRVRLHIPGEFQSITLLAWVRVDALPNVNNSLLMADGWEEGEIHWQIGSDGTLILGIKGPPDYQPAPNIRGPQYRAHGALTPERFGRWIHLAVAYDRERGEVVHYVDGKPVGRAEILLNLPLRIGDAELGNWNSAGYRNKTPIRNLNGCIDEFLLFNRALTREEVEILHTQGRPPL